MDYLGNADTPIGDRYDPNDQDTDAGDSPVTPQRARSLLFDWGGVVAIAIAAMTWATLASAVSGQGMEIQRLRQWRDETDRAAILAAANMATKADVQRVADQVEALRAEFRRSVALPR